MRHSLLLPFFLALSSVVAQPTIDPPLLWVRLQTPVHSGKEHTGVRVQAVVTVPYVGASGSVIPMGSIVTGQIESPNREKLSIEFQSLTIEGSRIPMMADVAEVDNARENVLPDGTILALERLKKRPSKIEMLLLAAAYAHPAAIAIAEGTKLTLCEVDKPSVHYPVGTDIALRFETKPTVPKRADVIVDPPSTAPSDLAMVLDSLPQRTETHESRRPADWVNLTFAGSMNEIEAAFTAAGWETAERLSLCSDVETFLALADRHSFKHAPVSRIEIAGRLPDVVYQKQTDTFAKRHHIRIWSTDQVWQGRPVWIAAATHDIGIDFSTEAKTFRIVSNRTSISSGRRCGTT